MEWGIGVKRNEQRLALWEKWKAFENTASMFEPLKRAACDQMVADAVRFSRLGSSDEGLYTHLVELMAVYRRVEELATGCQPGNPAIKALVMGICEVLTSRVRQFDEVNEPENPITAEKNEIIGQGVALVSKQADDQVRRFASLQEGISPGWHGEIHELFSHYNDGLKFCLARLDDIRVRKAAKLYMELIEKEWEELGNIINVPALEEAKSESITIVILDALREAHQQTGLVIEAFQKLLLLPPAFPAPGRPFDEFEAVINEALGGSTPSIGAAQEFLSALTDEITALFEGLNMEYMKAAYRLKRTISEAVLLAEEVAAVFGETLKNLPDVSLEAAAEPTERDILSGISETIEIKISSLKESTQDFNRQGLDMVRALTAETASPSDEELTAVLGEAKTMWTSSPPEENGIDSFFDMALHGEAFALCHECISKRISEYFENAKKTKLRFKQEVLLYEVCTYEEILIHSVSRLRTSANQPVADAAALLDKTFRDLEIILKKNNITVIKPEPHQPFDAKEHEVLVAEKQDGFERGEIIKLVTAGYRQDDQIILRANVIAAR